LDSAALLKKETGWSEGAPIVAEDGFVESGNGRLLGLRRAVEINPAGYKAYRNRLIEQAGQWGFNPADIRMRRGLDLSTRPIVVVQLDWELENKLWPMRD
jgi:hypothetical protein